MLLTCLQGISKIGKRVKRRLHTSSIGPHDAKNLCTSRTRQPIKETIRMREEVEGEEGERKQGGREEIYLWSMKELGV